MILALGIRFVETGPWNSVMISLSLLVWLPPISRICDVDLVRERKSETESQGEDQER